MTHANTGIVRDCIDGVDYPCLRTELLRHAASHGAGDDILGALSGLNDRQYRSADDVCGSIAAVTAERR